MTAAIATRADRLDELHGQVRAAQTLNANEVRRLAQAARALEADAHNLALTFAQIAHELETGEPF